MSTLFTINKSLHDAIWLHEQLVFAQAGDAILLIEDGVLALHSKVSLASFAAKCEVNGVNVYALQDDCALRGIENKQQNIQMIDYACWVNLVENHDKLCAW